MRVFVFSHPDNDDVVVKAHSLGAAWSELEKKVGDTTGYFIKGAQG